ncbi:MAG: NADP-dependent oxidoreductase, partial [Myxococcales bacterium]|nr:NADP-dependent oxidoreductase [Myxococcales bacterium]
MSRARRGWCKSADSADLAVSILGGHLSSSVRERRESTRPDTGYADALGPDQILVQNTHLAFEPAMRGWMEDRPSYIPPAAIGEVMRGMTVGQVLESNLEGYEPGDRVTGMTGWQEFAVGDRGLGKLPDGVAPEMALSLFGATGITAYFGLLDIGEPKEGETVVVSGAAGATGSIAGQIARIKGCRVIGIAGGSHECDWLLDEARFDGAIDYKHENVGERLSELCPNGIDIFFDNVGGPILDEVLARIAQQARVVLCGGISHYNDEGGARGPKNYFNLVLQRGRMEGFIVMDYLPRWGEAIAQLGARAAE